MKHRLIPLTLAIAALFSESAAIAEDLVTIKDSKAVDHIGERVEVRGVVSSVDTYQEGVSKGVTFITLGRGFPNQLVNVFVPSDAELASDSAFLKSLEGKEIGIIGRIELYRAKPTIDIRAKDQIKVEWKAAKEDPIDYLNGVVNDRYREKLGLVQALSKTELQKFKAYLDQNIKDWRGKDGEALWILVPKFLQTISDASH